MAIDTRDKRASVVFSAIRVGWPLADGTIDADDRRHISGGYRGITTGGAPAIGPYAVYPADVAFPYTEANWTNGSWYHEVTMRIASGTIYSRLWDATGSALVAGSEQSAASSSDFQRKRTGALTLVDGHEYVAQFAISTGGIGGEVIPPTRMLYV